MSEGRPATAVDQDEHREPTGRPARPRRPQAHLLGEPTPGRPTAARSGGNQAMWPTGEMQTGHALQMAAAARAVLGSVLT